MSDGVRTNYEYDLLMRAYMECQSERDAAIERMRESEAEAAGIRALADEWVRLAEAPIDKGPGFSARPFYAFFGGQLRALLTKGGE